MRHVIEAGQISLISFTPGDLLSLVRGAEEFRGSFGISAADGLREFLLGPEVSADYISMLESSPEPDVWKHGFSVVALGKVVGLGAFKGPPDDDGAVEIAYAIAPAFEGNGFATIVAGELAKFAREVESVRTVIAHTLPERNASTRVLEKNGFIFAGEVIDPEDGPVWQWELPNA